MLIGWQLANQLVGFVMNMLFDTSMLWNSGDVKKNSNAYFIMYVFYCWQLVSWDASRTVEEQLFLLLIFLGIR